MTDATPAGSLRHEKYRLANGMKVILHEDHSLPVACVNIWYGVGSKDEPAGRSGFAHLFEHLMFMGTERVPGSQFDELMERGGGANNATTSYDRTNYYSSGPSSLLPTLLWLEADRMEDLGRMMTQEKLDRQRDVVRNERRQSYENRPYGRADLAVGEELFPPGHPYHIPVIGSHEDLQAATVEDVRAFFATFYVPSNASLVVAGDFDPAATRRLIDELFGTLPFREAPVHAPMPPPVRLGRSRRLTLADDVQLCRLTLAWPSPALYAEGDAEMDVLASVLAHGRSSRLWRRLVRDEKLCNEVSAWQGSRQLASSFEIEATCAPETDLGRVEAIVDEELAKLSADGPTEDELRRVRNQIEHGMLVRLESLQDRADQLNAYEHVLGEPDSLASDLARYRAVTSASARRAAAETLTEHRVAVRVLTRSPRAERPAAAAARGFAFPEPESFRLDNGLQVHFWRRPQLPLLAARLHVPEGATGDGEAKAGLTQLALDMLDEGTLRMSASDFAATLETLGARLSIQARRESSVVALRATKATAGEAFGLMSEALLRPALAPSEWERVRELHARDLQSRDDEPGQVAAVVASRRLFPAGHPFSWPLDGDAASLAAISLDDVAARLRAILDPARATLLLAGDVSREEAESLASTGLGSWRAAEPGRKASVQAPSERPLEIALVHRPGAVQTVIRFAWRAPRFSDPSRPALELLNTILGGSFTSRLNQNLRETHGYTYGAGSRFVMLPSLGVASASSSVRADVTGASVSEFLHELDRIASGDVTDEEVAKAVATLRNRRVDGTAGLDGVLEQAEEMVSVGLPFAEIDRSLAALSSLGASDLNALAPGAVTPRKGVLVLVGDRETVLPQLAGLGLPSPVECDPAGRLAAG